jgi:twitching motility protein PilJ
MERSTKGVVQGTGGADQAEQALREIGAVSTQLAELIESISQATQQQAASASRVAANRRSFGIAAHRRHQQTATRPPPTALRRPEELGGGFKLAA